jgi:sigma-B regulation protein RsbU (phosphoserine phosphatase)
MDPGLPIVVMTGWGSIDTAVEAMRLGARSFVQKPWDDVTLLEILEREIAEARAARRRDRKQERELEEARLIQRGLLPTSAPQLPGIEVAVTWQPADGVGGDCFDTIAFGGAVGVSVADIAGKGLPAALLMSNLQAAVRAFALDAAAPSAICASVNRLLCRNMASGRFATFCYARIDGATRRVLYSNAGHNPPLVIRTDGSSATLTKGGMVLGVFPENTYDQAEVSVSAGDRLVFYTDGITEARNPAGEEYGEERLLAAALDVRTQSAEAIKTALLNDVNAFTGGQFEDDATLIVVAIR